MQIPEYRKDKTLNVNIQPIMTDVNVIINEHIKQAVTTFNIEYLTRELEEYKSKIDIIEKELLRLRNGNDVCVSCEEDNEQQENIQLEIKESESVITPVEPTSNNNVLILNNPEEETKSSKKETTFNKDEIAINFDDYVATSTISKEPQEDGPNDEDTDTDIVFEEEGVFEIELNGLTYFTNDENNGEIYSVDEDGDPGPNVGTFKNGKPIFSN